MAENKVCVELTKMAMVVHGGYDATGVGDNCCGMKQLVTIFDRESDPGQVFFSLRCLSKMLSAMWRPWRSFPYKV